MTLFGKLKLWAAGAGGLLILAAVILLRVFKLGETAERLKQYETNRKQEVKVDKRITDAQDAGNHVDRTIKLDHDQLRVDDGYKRRSKRSTD